MMTKRKTPEEDTGATGPGPSGNAETPSLEQALAEEKEKAANYLASWQRAQADFSNYKRRTEQERAEFANAVKANVVYGLLPILDNLERALEAVPPELESNSWVEGVRLLTRHFQSVLEAQGVSPINALGEPFDPQFHEAVRQDKGREGIVIAEVQKGYKLNDNLIRPSMVVVGHGEED
ncbi:MAG: nucleotide exchange factor GrpE [Chloroflexota bacterium]